MYHINGIVGHQPVAEPSNTQKHPLGRIVTAFEDGASIAGLGAGEFIYLKAGAPAPLGSLVTYDQFLGTTAIAPAAGGKGSVAVAMCPLLAGQYGWHQIAGTAAVKAPNAMVPGAEVFMLAATPGSVDDTPVAGEQVLNATVTTTTATPAAGLALIQINRPFLQGQIT
jgi:hypothetical protein